MNIYGLLKRIAPFFITFALGLFVASFFVSIALPNFRLNRNWRKHSEYHRKIEFENHRLRTENCRLRKEAAANRELRRDSDFEAEINELVPPPPPIPSRPAPYRR